MKTTLLTSAACAMALISSAAFANDMNYKHSKNYHNRNDNMYNSYNDPYKDPGNRYQARTWSDTQNDFKKSYSYKYYKDEGFNRFDVGTHDDVQTVKNNATSNS